MRHYDIVSADDHIQEPPDTFVTRVPAKLRDRVPRIERGDDGDAWVIDGKRGMTFGVSFEGGKKFEDYKFKGLTLDDARPGAWNPVERLKDMDPMGWTPRCFTPTCSPSI
jgi:hypothetical protein